MNSTYVTELLITSPIYHLVLEDLRRDLFRLIAAMCPVAHTYFGATCTFDKVRAEKPDRTEIIGTAHHIKKFCAVASDELQFVLFCSPCGPEQRQGDLIRLTWMQYDASKIRAEVGQGQKAG